ncbi:hypothetical protein BH11BAC3_BH11BAC3_07870 [soil metagenome]
MLQSTILISMLSMFLTADSIAQKKQAHLIEWTVAGAIPADKLQPSIGLAGPVNGIHHNVLIVAGGSNFPNGMPWNGGKKIYYSKGYVFSKQKNDQLKLLKSFQLPVSLAYAASCSIKEGVIVVGGENENGLSKEVFIMQWNETKKNIQIINLPQLPFAITNAAVACIENTVYLVGGETESKASDKLLCLELDNLSAGWKELAPVPKPVSHAVFQPVISSGLNCIYLLGGRKKNKSGISDLYASVYQYDPGKNRWMEKPPLPYALSAGTGAMISTDKILLFGGDKGETFHQTETLIAAINIEKDSAKKQILNQQKIQLQTNHPGFSNEVLLYNPINGECKSIGVIPFDTPVTTTALKWGHQVLIPCGEIKAGVRTPQILLGKIQKRR